MRKLSKIMSALLALSASNQLYAEQIQGTVINENGAAVVGATVMPSFIQVTAPTFRK